MLYRRSSNRVWVAGVESAAALAAQAAPGPEHARLGYFVGDWTAKGEKWMEVMETKNTKAP